MLYGIGYNSKTKGYITFKNKKKTREYALWQRIMERCYSEKFHKRSPTYINCKVCDRWHDYQNFCEDLPKIEGYELWLNNDNIHLDKDIKSKHLENKEYSIDTCKFVTPIENNCAIINKKNIDIETKTMKTMKKCIAVRIEDEYSEEFFNIRGFSRKYSLNPSNVRKVLNGEMNQTKGWTFTYI